MSPQPVSKKLWQPVQPLTVDRSKQESKLLPPGTKAPDFTLHVTPGQTLSLSDLAGRPVMLAF
jgi:AhpC/TSA family